MQGSCFFVSAPVKIVIFYPMLMKLKILQHLVNILFILETIFFVESDPKSDFGPKYVGNVVWYRNWN
jgi:hypothetical protein